MAEAGDRKGRDRDLPDEDLTGGRADEEITGTAGLDDDEFDDLEELDEDEIEESER